MSEISQRKRIWGWYFFDWASQPYNTVLLTFVFGPFFAAIAAQHFMGLGLSEDLADAEAQKLWSGGLALAGFIVAFGAPFIGALADTVGRVRPWVALFSIIYVSAVTGLWFTNPDGTNLVWAVTVFAIGFAGAEFALVFTNSQLPSLAEKENVGKISGSGFAFGYTGGLILLAIVLLVFAEQPNGKTLIGLDPGFGMLDASAREGTRIAGPLSALWYVVFMIPYALWTKDIAPKSGKMSFVGALNSLKSGIKRAASKVSLRSYLVGSMLYRDALNGLYGFGGVYAALVLNWDIVSIGVFGVVSGVAAAFFSYVGGGFDKKFGPKPVIITSIWVLIGVCLTIVFMSREAFFGIALAPGSNLPDIIFFACGTLIGGMGGILQAASRTMMVYHINPDAPTESFGLYGMAGRATAFLAPALIATATTITESARLGVSPLIFLFLLGLVPMIWVKSDGEK